MASWEAIIAGYAAVVATGALALEVRRWFESGARLVISIMPEAKMAGSDDSNQMYLAVTIMNRGDAATTLTHFALLGFNSLSARLRRRPSWSAIVLNPSPNGGRPNIPHELAPGAIWNGIAEHNDDLKKWLDSGTLYVAIYASHADKPTTRRVIRAAQPPADADKLEK